MYATAHRVKSRQETRGINAFLHEHGEGEVEGIDWHNIDMSFVTEQATGTLVSEYTEVAPGGNSVLSYLDVVCPDETPVAKIKAAISKAKADLPTSLHSLERSFGEVAVRFGAVFGLRGAETIEYDALAEKVLNIVERRATPVWMEKAPLRVSVSPSEDGFIFRLAAEDRTPTCTVKDVPLPLGVVRIDNVTMDAFESLYGDLMMHILPTVTGMTLAQLRSEGGVTVVQATTGRLIWEWPRRREHS